MLYLLRNNKQRWEDVTEYVFKNAKHALDENDKQRYDGTAVLVDSNVVHIVGTLSVAEMGPICRMINVKIPTGSLGDSCITQPATIKFKKGKGVILHHLETGENYKKV